MKAAGFHGLSATAWGGRDGGMKNWVWGIVTIAILAAGLAVLPRGLEAFQLLAGPRDEAAVAHYALTFRTPADYTRGIDAAVAAKDEDLAASLLAQIEGHPVAQQQTLLPHLVERQSHRPPLATRRQNRNRGTP